MTARTLLRSALTVSLLALAPAAFGQDPTAPQPGMGGGGMTPTAKETLPPGQTATEVKVVTAEGLMYRANPDFLPKGAEIAALDGDPARGPGFAARVRLPDNWRMPANTNTGDLHVTVLQGAIRFMPGATTAMPGGTTGTTGGTGAPTGGTGAPMGGATGGTTGQGQMVGEGGFVLIPRNQAFSLMTEEPTVLHVQGIGAWNPRYLTASDDPRAGTRPAGTSPTPTPMPK